MKELKNKSLAHEMSDLTAAELSCIKGGGFKFLIKFTVVF